MDSRRNFLGKVASGLAGTLAAVPAQVLGANDRVRVGIIGAGDRGLELLNQILADTMTLRDMRKKHHWQVAGQTFYQLHLLFEKHYGEQVELVDVLAERIQILGGISVAMAPDVAEMTLIPRLPRGREEAPVQLSRLLEAHEIILKEARTAARQTAEAGDDGTNDLLVSQVIRTNELQVWFVAEHLVDVPVVRAD